MDNNDTLIIQGNNPIQIHFGYIGGSAVAGDETDPVYTADKPNLALKSEIPTKTSDLTNDSGFITNIPQNLVTEQELNNKGYLTSFTQSDPVYSKDKPNIALKSEIFTPTTTGDGNKFLSDNGLYTEPNNNFVRLPTLIKERISADEQFIADLTSNYPIQMYLDNFPIENGYLKLNVQKAYINGITPTIEIIIPYTANITTFEFPTITNRINIPESITYNEDFFGTQYAVFVVRQIQDNVQINYSYSFAQYQEN